MSKFLEDSVLELSRKVDEGFSGTHKELTEINMRITRVEGAITHHATADQAAQSRVAVLDQRLAVLEKPYKWAVWTFAGAVALIGFLSALVSVLGYFTK